MNNSDTPHQAAALTIDQALQQAIAHHQAGKLQEAEQLYRAILQAQPNHPDANHNLGVLALQVKQPAAAVPYFKLALEFNPNQGQRTELGSGFQDGKLPGKKKNKTGTDLFAAPPLRGAYGPCSTLPSRWG